MNFEEVMVSDPATGYEIEYINEYSEEVGTAAINAPVSPPTNTTTNNVDNTPVNVDNAPVKKKIPIIRKPGEIVTPVHVRTSGNVKVSPLTASQRHKWAIPVRSKVALQKVEPPLSKVLVIPAPRVATDEEGTVHPESEDLEQKSSETFDHEYAEAAVTDRLEHQTQMDRIEKKLDMILQKLNQHDAAFKAIKYNMKDLRVELQNSAHGHKEVTGATFDANNGPPPKRKRLVCFPVADDNYLLRLEDLLQVDDQIKDEVTWLFKQAPRTSVYEFLRKNANALFENCSKYTWTGKPSNAMPTMAPANVAGKLALVDHLITCAWETFPHLTRESIAKEFRRALTNFNDAVGNKRKKRLEIKLANAGQVDEFDTNAETDHL